MNIFEKFIDYIAWLSAWLFCVAGFMLSYEVIARYFFLSPTIWAAELSQISLIYGTLLAMPWALKARKHIQINLVINQLSKTNKKFINIFCSCLTERWRFNCASIFTSLGILCIHVW